MKIDAIVRRLSDRKNSDHDPFAQMIEDSRLPGDIRPAPAVPHDPPTNILLTGATGFLGGHLLHALLRQTSAHVWCLSRQADSAACRVRRNLEAYGIWDPGFQHRVSIVNGDLSSPSAGMSITEYASLANSIDAVFHCGAAVNWIYPYRRLAGVNVRGTQELLRFACTGKSKEFHFVSSSAVCYSTLGPRQLDETDDMLPHLRGIHLGYAQTKCVAESLVRQAGERGLPVTIYRPALISGESRTGRSNAGDFLSIFIKGCIAMGSAPDLDWMLDCCPVDWVAQRIAGMAGRRAMPSTFHLLNPQGRHWHELILWINLFGYPVRLISYRLWLEELKRTLQAPHHPLREIAPFFCAEVPGETGTYLPQLYQENRRAAMDATRSRRVFEISEESCPPMHALNAELLDRYFDSFIRTGFLPQPCPATRTPCGPQLQDTRFDLGRLSSIIGTRVVKAVPLRSSTDHSIMTELTSWRFKNQSGLFRYRLDLESGAALDVMVKVKPHDSEVIDVGSAIAGLCSEELGAAYSRCSYGLEFVRSHLREPAIYAQRDARFRRHVPEFHGAADGTLILEYLSDVALKDSVDDVAGWTLPYIEAAIDGVSDIHAMWFERGAQLLRHAALGPAMWSSDMIEMTPFWIALAHHANPLFSACAPDIPAIQMREIANIGNLARMRDGLPMTLIHNDFNPRNIAFRKAGAGPRLCAYDWEMARLGLPQHDLAELLCFVLTSSAGKPDLHLLLERHRTALGRAAGVLIDREGWLAGFRLSLVDLLINRFSMYAMVNRFRPQRYLPRVMRTWRHLYQMFR